jgi:cobalt-zinc-cadmium efflux system outer membrane protein
LTAVDATALTLSLALIRSGDCHPDVRLAAGALAATRADIITAGQGANPQLTVGAASLGHDLGSGSLWNKTFDTQVRIDQALERGDKPALRRAAAQALYAAAQADFAESRRRARLATAQAYHELAAALARREETAASLGFANDAQRAQGLRVKAGDVAPIEATRLALDAIRVQADLRQADADVHAARVQLSAMLGAEALAAVLRPVDAWTGTNASAATASGIGVGAAAGATAKASTTPAKASASPGSNAPTASTFDDLRAENANTERRPDVVAAQLRLTAAERSRDLALAQRVRDVSVGVQLDRYPTSATNTSGSGNTVSLSVSVPLFLRHTYEGEVARAEADVANAREAVRRARLAAQSDYAQARSRWAAAAERRRLAADELAPAAEKVAAGAELAYRRGASSLLDVLDARRSLRAARIERINAEADAARAAAELEAASATLAASTP